MTFAIRLRTVLVMVIAVLRAYNGTTAAAAFDSDLTGSFCAIAGCCAHRRDQCSVPILGTLCYCDDFCDKNRTESAADCCPDYWSVCTGAEPPVVLPLLQLSPPSARHHSPQHANTEQNSSVRQYCNYGKTVNINCNQCQCQEINGKPELRCTSDECLIDPSLLDKLNNMQSDHHHRLLGWSVKNYSEFWGRTYEDGLKLRLGSLQSPEQILQMTPTKIPFPRNPFESSFDLRKVWGDNISHPMDQGWCGASWAVTTVQVIADRFRITSKGALRDALSAQHLLSCDNRDQKGCQGGHLIRAWNWIRKFGLVTEECYPWKGRTTDCAVPKRRKESIATCPRPTESDRRLQPKTSRLHRVTLMYRVTTEAGIMYEIKNWGSVQAMMKVSKDFFVYESGVYRCSDSIQFVSSRTGYHTVRIVGWGEEHQNDQTVRYWIVSNSWGTLWGENGYFRILKGVNECQIEDFVVAAKVEDVNDLVYA